MRVRSFPARCAALVLSVVPLLGQATTSVRGHVTDQSGGAIVGAAVTVLRVDTDSRRQTTTNNEGFYEFVQLAPGAYNIHVSASGFTAAERPRLNLLVNSPATADFKLDIATSIERVEVMEATGAVVNTEDATLGTAFDTRQVEQLPIEARNVVELLSLQAGVTYLGDRIDRDSDTRSGSVNGARSDQSNITLDGVDVNDQNKSYAFTSVLRNTQDSVQEFRVTTSNANADQGRSSGAQVALVTKSGSNTFHGSAYEYDRNTLFSANEYFLKSAEIEAGKPNERSKLIRNVFGGAVGGPILKNRLFFFTNYEGRRDREAASVVRTVPNAAMRNGAISYMDANGGTQTLSPGQIKAMDPLGVGVNPAVAQILNSYPLPNDASVGDGLNTSGYRFAADEKRKFDTYIARLDYTVSTRNTLFWRGNLQNDNAGGPAWFPGQPASTALLDNSKGFAAGHTFVLSPTKVNSLRWGFTRQGGEQAGASTAPEVTLAGMDSPSAFTRSSSYKVPIHNLVDDFSWTHGAHSLQFGGNVRLISNGRLSYSNAFSTANINLGWLLNSGIANKGVAFDPAFAGLAAVASSFQNAYDDAVMTMVGMVTEGNAIYNYDKNGNALPLGSPVRRNYRWNEYEWYGQDAWKITPHLTLTYGLRWTYLQPPAETNGAQVGACVISGASCNPYALTDWLNISAQQGLSGGAASAAPHLSFAPNGRYNGQADFWRKELTDFSPRVSVAWAPDFGGSWMSRIFGAHGRTAVRAGYSLVYDHFGAAAVNSYDAAGSYGLTSQVSNVPGSVRVDTAPRFTGISSIPAGLLPAAPAGGFPATPDPEAFAITWGMDRDMKTPYAHVVDFSISRELSDSMSLDVAYVGRFARRLPVQEDVAMPLDLVDPKSKMDYFAAATMLSKLGYAGTPAANVQPIPYWENLYPQLAGIDLGFGPASATQVVYSQFMNNLGNETYGMFLIDLPDSQSGAGLNVAPHSYAPYRFYHDQYSALYAWRTIGQSSYNGLHVTLHRRFSHGLQGDFNYTWSKSFDWTSQAERIPTSGGNNLAQIINTWRPDQLRGVSDFDATHQINANWIFELPVGNGRVLGHSLHPVLNAVVGGWQLNGLMRWTSGFPFSVDEGSTWPTNWDIEGFAMLQKGLSSADLRRGRGPQAFANPGAAFDAFRIDYPGESGTRNPLRGDGYIGLDAGLSKVFPIRERALVRLRWDVFNVTNSVRFDVQSIGNRLDRPSDFGRYTQTLTQPRVMQVAMRLEF